MKPLLLWDIDGTILRTYGASERAMARAAVGVMGESYSLENVTFSGGQDRNLFFEGAQQSGLSATEEDHARFREDYLRLLKQELEENSEQVVTMPGVRPLIESLLDDSRVVLGLLTGNYAEGASHKLSQVGIDPAWFKIGAFGDHAPTRPELVPVALAQYRALRGTELDASRVIVIGDTPKDVNCAHKNGCLALAVATGQFSVEELEGTGADVVAADLSSPEPLMGLISTLLAL